MENNKYYTPELEEFCVGFEFEQFDTWGSWRKFILTEDLLNKRDIPIGSGNECQRYWQNTRVKYLDKTDIESFCFINILTTGTQRFKKYVNLKQLEDGEWFDYYLFLSLRYFDNTPHITIKKIDIHTYEEEIEVNDNVKTEYLFQGYVKNKHEFKKLLKQLGINGNN